MDRNDIHLISRHSNLTSAGARRLLQEKIYNSVANWNKFLRLFFISLGVGLSVIGVIFFFAYNWDNLHKFAKLGLVQSLLLIVVLFILFSKAGIYIKKIALTGAAVLVGALFAVFGQIYQTGANAYDFFFGWVVFITLWVIVADFPPLWFIYILLINTTIYFYSEQVARDWQELSLLTLLLVINMCFLLASIFLPRFRQGVQVPLWFTNLLTLGIVYIATMGVCLIIIGDYTSGVSSIMLIALTAISYGLGIVYAFKAKRAFYLAVIAMSLIIIFSTFIIQISDNDFIAIFFFVSMFIVGSVTLMIRFLLNLQKKWKNENTN